MQWKHTFLNYLLLAGLLLSASVLLAGIDSLTAIASASAFSIAFLICLILYNKKSMKAEERYEVFFNSEFIEGKHPERPNEILKWGELNDVTIISTDKGPYEPYLWISLNDHQGQNLTFPLGARNSRDLIERILGLEKLDLELWAKAMASTQNQKFVVWRRVR